MFDITGNSANRTPRGYIDGCITSNGTDTTNDINIAAGICRDSTNSVDIVVAAMLGKQLDTGWAPGAGAGMRNSAVAITNTTYHIYAVAKADGTQDIYAHTSADVATVLAALQAESGGSSYLYARLIWSILRESGTIIPFVQRGDWCLRGSASLDISAANPGTSAVNALVAVPLGLNVLWRGQILWSGATNNALLHLSSPDITDQAPSSNAAPLNSGGRQSTAVVNTGFIADVWTNTAAQIRYRASASGASDTVCISTTAWKHPRGKDN